MQAVNQYIVIEKIKQDKARDPSDPEIVFFGLIFDNLGPFKVLPTINPPISEAIQVNKIRNNIIFN